MNVRFIYMTDCLDVNVKFLRKSFRGRFFHQDFAISSERNIRTSGRKRLFFSNRGVAAAGDREKTITAAGECARCINDMPKVDDRVQKIVKETAFLEITAPRRPALLLP